MPGRHLRQAADGTIEPGDQAGGPMTELIVGARESDTHQKALRINLDPRWYGEGMVPPEVAELIKRRAFFGYVKPGRD